MKQPAPKRPEDPSALQSKPGAWVEVGLTIPVFLLYHLGVVFLDMRNATDFVTARVLEFAEGSLVRYFGITIALGVIMVAVFAIAGRGQAFTPKKFGQIAAESVVYAILMRIVGGYAVRSLALWKALPDVAGVASVTTTSANAFACILHHFMPSIATGAKPGRLDGFIMSLGAGFYEELTFRVLLFGLGYKALVWLLTREKVNLIGPRTYKLSSRIVGIALGWGLFTSLIFSGIHYVGALGDNFQVASFVFRAVLGISLTTVYAARGFAAAVWTHALWDIWVLTIAPS
jgi:hypothetical protein